MSTKEVKCNICGKKLEVINGAVEGYGYYGNLSLGNVRETKFLGYKCNECHFAKMHTKGDDMTWDELKSGGSEHYKSIGGAVEPIDLYRAKGVFKAFALCSIIKYAVRNTDKDLNPKDMEKIIHYARLLIAELPIQEVSKEVQDTVDMYEQMKRRGTEFI